MLQKNVSNKRKSRTPTRRSLLQHTTRGRAASRRRYQKAPIKAFGKNSKRWSEVWGGTH